MAVTYVKEGGKRLRSPPYPFITLSKAIERAKDLYAHARHHQVGMGSLSHAWNYGAKSSGLVQTAAALVQFGLLADEGSGDSRKFQLTDDALRIVLDQEAESDKREAAIRRVALNPKIHREIWDKYGAADVSDGVLKSYLTLDRREAGLAPFGEGAADDLIAEYRETVAFAGLASGDILPSSDEDKEDVDDKPNPSAKSDTGRGEKDRVQTQRRNRQRERQPSMKEDVFTLQEGDVVIQWPDHLSRESYEDLEAWTQLILRKIKRHIALNEPITGAMATEYTDDEEGRDAAKRYGERESRALDTD